MKQRIVTISGILLAIAAGSIAVFNWESATPEQVFAADWDFVDRDTCTLSACNAAACVAAQNHIDDAGYPCVVKFASCNTRINARLRAAAAANGVTLGAAKYQRLRVGVEICDVDAGPNVIPAKSKTFGLALDDAGWPLLGTVVAQTPPCVRAPLAGGTGCQRSEGDGGFRYFGAGNVFPAALSNSDPSCQPVECSVFFGDDPNEAL